MKDHNISLTINATLFDTKEPSLNHHKDFCDSVKTEKDPIKCDTETTNQCTRWTQTSLTLPPILSIEVEDFLRKHNLLNDGHNMPGSIQCTSSPLTQRVQVMPRSYSRIASIVSNTSGNQYNYLVRINFYIGSDFLI